MRTEFVDLEAALCLMEKHPEPTPMLGITGVIDENHPAKEPEAAEGGAMGMSRYFGTILFAKLDPCLGLFETACTDWADKFGLPISTIRKTETRLKVLIWDKKREGLFELQYKWSDDGNARVWMHYYALDGTRLAPEIIPEFSEGYEIKDLWKELRKSMACIGS